MKFLLVSLFLFTCTFTRLDRYFFKQNGSFCPKHVLPNWSRLPHFETSFSAEAQEILDQPFSYLTKGKQSFVFVSQDQKWILKLIRLPRYVMRYSMKGTSSSLNFLTKTLEACQSAHEELGQETQIVYAHLSLTSTFRKSVTLVDNFGEKYFLDLNDFPFVIQRYGSAFFSVFDALENQKAMIAKTIGLFSSLYQKGFIDRDPILDKNFGVVDETPFIIDIGQLEKTDHLPSRKKYLREMTQSLGWKLEKESPELYSFYTNSLH